LRGRADGWSTERQARFLVELAKTRSVAAAARAMGMSRVSAYRLRKRLGAESFAETWDAVIAGQAVPQRKFTQYERFRRATGALVQPLEQQGRFVGIAEMFDDSMLFAMLARRRRTAAERRSRGALNAK
jgi:hypothetical protein